MTTPLLIFLTETGISYSFFAFLVGLLIHKVFASANNAPTQKALQNPLEFEAYFAQRRFSFALTAEILTIYSPIPLAEEIKVEMRDNSHTLLLQGVWEANTNEVEIKWKGELSGSDYIRLSDSTAVKTCPLAL